MALPSDCLVQPTIEFNILDVMDKIAEFTSVLSASHWFCVAYKHLSGTDLEELLQSSVSGDWKAVGEFGSALHHLGEYFYAYGSDVATTANSVIGVSWEGNAAEDAGNYFIGFAVKLTMLRREFTSLSIEYNAAAGRLREAGQAVVGVLEALIDLIAGLPEIVILTVLSILGMPVGIGEVLAVVDLAAIVYEAWNVIKLIVKLIEVIGLMVLVMQVFAAIPSATRSLLGVLDRELKLAGGSYDHPGVGR